MNVAIKMIAAIILGSGVFERILAVVKRWSDKELSGPEKRAGVIGELELLGIGIANHLVNLAIELSVAYLKKKAS
jgi:hypothetical protein